MKNCYVCGSRSENFHKGSTACKPCAIERSRKWRLENPERHRSTLRNCALKRRYGIDEADYQRLLSEQGGACAICRNSQATRLNVDHDHVTGSVRGLLCRFCNLSLAWHERYAGAAGKYLYSDKPFRLKVEPILISSPEATAQ